MFEEVCLYRPLADAKGVSGTSPTRGSKAEFDDKNGDDDADAKDYKGHK